jgi:phospholipid/cholesterol/gamma-HCH transport system substrate-binding protein
VRRHKPRVTNFVAGLIAMVVIAAACYLVFGGSLPFSGTPFKLKAMFTSETELHIPSPVRIAGVDVGEVVSVQRVSRTSTAAVVTMNINRNGLPIHANATAEIRPRLFLEGNFYIDLHPGSAGARELSSGATIPPANTSGPVQLDRVLSALNGTARGNLQTVLQGLGGSLNTVGTRAENKTQDPSTSGLTGAQSLNESLRYSADALQNSAIVNQALLGTQAHDLSKVVVGNQRIFRALASKATQLASLVTTFNSTMAAFAARQQDLSATIAILPGLLRNTDATLGPLNASFGPTTEFARALEPSIKQLGPTIDAGLPWLAQSKLLLSNNELGGLLKNLTPAVQNTAASIGSTKSFVSQAVELARCFTNVTIPTGDEVIKDPPLSTGLPVYQELFQGAVGLAGASGNFDGNGRYLRSAVGGGPNLVETSVVKGLGPFFGNQILAPIGTRPSYPGHAPPINRTVPCFRNHAPNLNAANTGGTP